MSYNYTDNNPFYNQCHDSVFTEIDSRAKKYGSVERGGTSGQPIHEWLYGKTAYVIIEYLTSGKYTTVLEPPKQGFDSLYGSNYFPPPVVNSVRISNEGDYGSLMKAEINFTVFTLGDLEKFSTTLLAVLPGEEQKTPPVKIKWGWSQAGNGGTEQFYGYVTNFDWTLRPDGGFDCVSHLIGEGFFSLGTRPDATVKDTTKASISNDQYVAASNWMLVLKRTNTWEKDKDGVISGFGTFSLPGKKAAGIRLMLDVANNSETSTDKDTVTAVSTEVRYVTLEYICYCITKTLQSVNVKDSNGKIIAPFKYHEFICNKDVSKSYIYPDIVSADPINVIFPDFDVYDNTSLIKVKNFKMQQDRSTVDLSQILVSIDFLLNQIETIKNEKTGKTNFKASDVSNINLLNKIFEKIKSCSGGLYDLCLVNPKVETNDPLYAESLNKWIVMDQKYIGNTGVKVLTIPVMKNSSIARNITLTSKLPNDMATAQFIGAISSLTGKTPATIGAESKTVVGKSVDEVLDELDKCAIDLRRYFFRPENVASLETALNEYAKYGLEEKEKPKGPIIPLELSITLDGIKGFRFGNTITISYLPSTYKDVVFTVTKIEHNITNNDWTTVLTTVCRLKV